MSILERIVEVKLVEAARLARRSAELRERAEGSAAARPFRGALRGSAVGVIAEFKRRSPSAGELRAGLAPAAVANAYETGGASALSVLTDGAHFGGSLEDLRVARSAVRLPVLRKDFVLEPVQVWESRAGGADAVLLIVRILEDARLADLLALAAELGMAALVETHDAAEVERALSAGAEVIGVNNRDLSTFRTDLGVAEGLAPLVPGDRVLVAESGIGSTGDVARLADAGVDAVLVGESLVRSAEPSAALRALTGVPRRERAVAGGA